MYWGDYAKNTLHLSAEEHGIYILLIAHYWQTGVPIPDDKKLIKNLCKSSWKKCEKILTGFFIKTPHGWRHERIQKEIEKSSDISTKNSDKARAAAQARWGAKSNAPSMPQGVPEDCHPHSPSQSQKEGVGDSAYVGNLYETLEDIINSPAPLKGAERISAW